MKIVLIVSLNKKMLSAVMRSFGQKTFISSQAKPCLKSKTYFLKVVWFGSLSKKEVKLRQ